MEKSGFEHVNLLSDKSGKIVVVAAVEDAIDFLHHHWPDKKSRKFNTAEKACSDAVQGKQTAKAARAAFVSAAKEANLYVKERTP
jgi:hypothetical protein